MKFFVFSMDNIKKVAWGERREPRQKDSPIRWVRSSPQPTMPTSNFQRNNHATSGLCHFWSMPFLVYAMQSSGATAFTLFYGATPRLRRTRSGSIVRHDATGLGNGESFIATNAVMKNSLAPSGNARPICMNGSS